MSLIFWSISDIVVNLCTCCFAYMIVHMSSYGSVTQCFVGRKILKGFVDRVTVLNIFDSKITS